MMWRTNLYDEMSSCEIAKELAESALLKSIIGCKAALCIVGIASITLFLVKKGLGWLAHPHTQCMFSMHIAYSYLATTFYLICFITDLIRFGRDHSDPCDYALPFPVAFPIRLIAVIGTFGQLFSMAAIAVERLYASVKPANYERLNSRCIKLSSSIVVFVLAVGLNIGLCVPGVRWDEPAHSFTIRTLENQTRFQMLVNLEVLLELVVLFVFHFSLFLNFRKKISSTNYVAARYQVTSNKRVIVLLLPVFWTHFMCISITSFGLAFYPYLGPEDTPANHGVFLECVAVAPLYAVTLPFILFVSLQAPKESASSFVHGGSIHRGEASSDHSPHMADEHFRNLQTLFAKQEKETTTERFVREGVRSIEAMCCCRVDV